MNFDDVPVGSGASGVGTSRIAVDAVQPGRAQRTFEKKPFLRRGEGVELRLNAYKYRKPGLSSGSADAADNEQEQAAPRQPAARGAYGSPSKRGGSSAAFGSPRKAATPRKPTADQHAPKQQALSRHTARCGSYARHRPGSDLQRGAGPDHDDGDAYEAPAGDTAAPEAAGESLCWARTWLGWAAPAPGCGRPPSSPDLSPIRAQAPLPPLPGSSRATAATPTPGRRATTARQQRAAASSSTGTSIRWG
jgi:hypothetical protein